MYNLIDILFLNKLENEIKKLQVAITLSSFVKSTYFSEM